MYENMNAQKQSSLSEALAKMQERGDAYARQMMLERHRLNQLQDQLQITTQEINCLRNENKEKAIKLMNMHNAKLSDSYKRVDGKNPTKLAEANQKSLLKNLEVRLNKALVRQNEITNENEEIKAKIDKERVKICHDYTTRLDTEKKLKVIQNSMDEILRSASAAVVDRDLAIGKISQITEENQKEQEEFEKEYEDLSYYIAEQNSLLEQSITSAASAVVCKANASEDVCDSASKEEDTHTSQQLENTREELERTRENLIKTEAQIEKYQNVFEKLQNKCGLSSMSDVSSVYIVQEEESFSLFNYIQRTIKETEMKVEQCIQLEEEMKKYEEEQLSEESRRRAVVDHHQRMLNKITTENEKLNLTILEGKETVKHIAKTVQKLYIKLRCNAIDSSFNNNDQQRNNNDSFCTEQKSSRMKPTSRSTQSFLPSLFSGQGVSERNILNSMEMIEKRITQLILEYERHLAKSSRPRRASLLMTPKVFERIRMKHEGNENVGVSGYIHSLDGLSTGGSSTSDSSSESDLEDNVAIPSKQPISLEEMRKQAAKRHSTFYKRYNSPMTPTTRNRSICTK